MKKYKLLKDLPFAKAGEEFFLKYDMGKRHVSLYKEINDPYSIRLHEDLTGNFDEWFEEVLTFGEYYYVIDVGHVGYLEDGNYRPNDTLGRMKIGNIFKTQEEAEKYLEYLKAKAIIKQDTKGFKPDWKNLDELKFFGFWNYSTGKADFDHDCSYKTSVVYFKSKEDIKESFEKHPEEWKTYLTYEQ